MTEDRKGCLAGLGPNARRLIEQAAERVVLPSGETLMVSGQPTVDVYFIETGFLSLNVGACESGVEVALIGREAILGSWLLLGVTEAPFNAVARTATRLLKLPASVFRQACTDYPDLRAAALADQGRFTGSVADTCHAQARLTVEGRLARWLLLAHDRLEGDTLAITHEALSSALGVRRPGVTVAMHVLEGEHMVKATRGLVRILDREKLAHVAGGRYDRSMPYPERATPRADRRSTAMTA